jgi:hypothetical protein
MIGKNEFYIKSLQNLTTTNVAAYEAQMLSTYDLHLELKQFLYLPYLKEITKFTTKLNAVNRDYFDYNINYEAYLNQVNDTFKELKFFIFNDLNFLPDMSRKYQIFHEKIAFDDVTNEKIVEIRKCIKHTLFFQKIEEFLHIYSEGKNAPSNQRNKGYVGFTGVQSEYLKMTLNFLFMMVNKDYENLCLLMNFKSRNFVIAFFDVQDALFDFLELISEMLFSNQKTYQFDNFYFFTECLNEIINRVSFDKTDDHQVILFLF